MISRYGQVEKIGCFVFPDGDRYEGHFQSGAMHGLGVYYWAKEQSTYFGYWNDNSQNGCGVKFYKNGALEYGEWKDDQFLGHFTGVCGPEESYGAMNDALDVAQRARMFKYKPESEVTLQRRAFTLHQDPVIYQEGTEWMMPGWRGEMYEAPSAEELESQHPRLHAQMQRHNEIWERAWRYYNLDLQDALENKANREAAQAEREAAAAEYAKNNVLEGPDELAEAIDDYDEYGEEETKAKKKKKGKKGKKGKTGPASLTLSLRNAGAAIERAFDGLGKFALRRPEIRDFAARRQQETQRREQEQRPATPFASLSLSMPFGPFAR